MKESSAGEITSTKALPIPTTSNRDPSARLEKRELWSGDGTIVHRIAALRSPS
jgi:hypothetical protein